MRLQRRRRAVAAVALAALAIAAAPVVAQDEGGPSVELLSPTEGTIDSGNGEVSVTVRVAVEDFQLAPPGSGEGDGHLHVSLVPGDTFHGFNDTGDEGEGAALGEETVSAREVTPTDGRVRYSETAAVGRWVGTDSTTVTFLNVPPQEYVVRAQLAEPDHSAVEPAAWDQVGFLVDGGVDSGLEPGEAPSPVGPDGAPLGPALAWALGAALIGGAAFFFARRYRGDR